MKPKLCNMEYTDNATGLQRICKTTPPGAAIRQRATARVCASCWPEVLDLMASRYPTHITTARQTVDRVFKKVR